MRHTRLGRNYFIVLLHKLHIAGLLPGKMVVLFYINFCASKLRVPRIVIYCQLPIRDFSGMFVKYLISGYEGCKLSLSWLAVTKLTIYCQNNALRITFKKILIAGTQ